MNVVWCLYFLMVQPDGAIAPLSSDKPIAFSGSYEECMKKAQPVMSAITAYDKTLTGAVFCLPLDPANVDMETY